MAGLSGAASVIAVIQITGSICSLLKDYYQGVHDAREEIDALHKVVRALALILTEIENLIKRNAISEPQELLLQCKTDLLALRAAVETSLSESGSKRRHIKSLKWPFKRWDVNKRIAVIERHKSALSVYLGVENISINLDQINILDEIRSDISSASQEERQRRIVQWLSETDPSNEQNAADEKHQESTGSWLTTSEDFGKWMRNSNSFFWLHGGAGCGKTILCSTVVNAIKANCKASPLDAMAFWYFSFTDQRKQSTSNLLGSLAAQLCSQRRDTPQELLDAYDSCTQGTMRPGINDLIKLLHSLVSGFDNVYLIVDALDECPKMDETREKLLDVLIGICTWEEERLHTFLTSRREVDIDRALSPLCLSRNNHWIKTLQPDDILQDVRLFIRQTLDGRTFSRWKGSLKREVEDTLSKRAQGSFRLIALQVDEIRRSAMLSNNKIRSLLKALPQTLDGHYDRMLLNIDADSVYQAQLALKWLAFSVVPMSLPELAEAIAIRADSDDLLDPDDRLQDESGILAILPVGLLTASPDEELSTPRSRQTIRLRFAHFSVKEYVLSDRILGGPASAFHVDETSAHSTIASSCIAYMLYAGRNFQNPEPNQSETLVDMLYRHRKVLESKFPLIGFSSSGWPYHVDHLGLKSSPQLADLIVRFLKPDEPAFQLWKTMVSRPLNLVKLEYENQFDGNFRVIDVNDGSRNLTLNMNTNYHSSRDMALNMNRKYKSSVSVYSDNPMVYAFWLGLAPVARMLLEPKPCLCRSAAGTNSPPRLFDIFSHPAILLIKAAAMGDMELIKILLENEVDVKTSLQSH